MGVGGRNTMIHFIHSIISLEKIKARRDPSSKDMNPRFYIFNKSDPHKIVGDISISNIVREIFQCGFLGYKIDKKQNGKGIATEAVGRVIEFAFIRMNLHRLEANVMPDNIASIRVLEKLKFEKEGFSKKYLKINDKWEDHVRYSIINNQNSDV